MNLYKIVSISETFPLPAKAPSCIINYPRFFNVTDCVATIVSNDNEVIEVNTLTGEKLSCACRLMDGTRYGDAFSVRATHSQLGYLCISRDWRLSEVWDVNIGINLLEDEISFCAAFSPDGQHLLSGNEIWSIPDKKVIKTLPGFDRWSYQCATFNLTGNMVAVSSDSQTLLFENPSFKLLATLSRGGCVLKFSPDGKYLVTDNSIFSLRINRRKLMPYTGTSSGEVTSMVFIDDTTVFLGRSRGSINVVDLPTAKCIAIYPLFQGNEILDLSLVPEKNTLLVATANRLTAWRLSGDTPPRILDMLW